MCFPSAPYELLVQSVHNFEPDVLVEGVSWNGFPPQRSWPPVVLSVPDER